MVVLSLVLTAALLCYSAFSSLEHIVVRFQLEQLCATCLYLQQQARTQKKDITLRFDLKNNTYTYDNHVHVFSKQVRCGFLPKSKGPPGSPNRLIIKACTFPNNSITFYSSGIISSGTLYIVDRSFERMYALSNAVSQVSYLRLYRYNGTWRLL